jgi:catalase
VSFLSRIS